MGHNGQDVSKKPDNSSASKQRDLAFEAFRGIGILCVVVGHSNNVGLHFPEDTWNYWYSLFLRHTLMAAVPCFLLPSGYWLSHLIFNSQKDYFDFLKKRASRILIPYLFWSLIFIVIHALQRHSFSMIDTLRELILGQAQGPYYFIVMLLQFYLLLPILLIINRNKSNFRWIVLAHFIFVLVYYVIKLWINKDLSFSYYQVPFMTWLSFFYMGMYFRIYPETLERFKTKYAIMLAIIFYTLSMIEASILVHYDYDEMATSPTKLTCFLYAASLLLVFLKLRHHQWPRLFIWLGDYCFGIYLIHSAILSVIENKMHSIFPTLFNIQPLYQLFIFFLTIVTSGFIVFAARKIIGENIARKLLGF